MYELVKWLWIVSSNLLVWEQKEIHILINLPQQYIRQENAGKCHFAKVLADIFLVEVGFKRLFDSASRPMPTWKPVSRVEVGIETGFHAGIGRNADSINLLKTHLRASPRSWPRCWRLAASCSPPPRPASCWLTSWAAGPPPMTGSAWPGPCLSTSPKMLGG